MTEEDDRARLERLRGQTLWGMLVDAAERFSGKEALVAVGDDGAERRVTYDELLRRSRALSAGLAGIGVRRGDRLALWMTNLPEFVYVYFAAMRLGAVLVPVSTRLVPREVRYVVGQSGSRHLVLLDGFRRVDFLAALEAVCPGWRGSTAGRLMSDELPDLRTVTVLGRDGRPAAGRDRFDLAALMQGGNAPADDALADAMGSEVRASDLAMIKYTSGSTGFPKGAMLEQGGLVANAVLHSERLEISSADRWFSGVALFHAGGSVWGMLTALVRGATLVFTETFEAERGLEVAARERCTAIFGVPAMLRDYASALRSGSFDLGAVRLMGGSVDPALADELRRLVPSLTTTINAYGLTEAYATCAAAGPRDRPELQAATCGRPYRGLECRAVDPTTGRDVGPGEVGEALLRGLVMRGYWNKPEETAAAVDADGWLHTGDLVSIDADGYIRYVGRIKTMLKVAGENVAVEEVENVIAEHDDVDNCAVVGVADARKDQAVWAYVVRRSAEVGADQLRAWCEERLARFKVPERFVFVDDLPRTGSGKVDRPAVEQLASAAA
jgi:fatty-acyl-CoA synthase